MPANQDPHSTGEVPPSGAGHFFPETITPAPPASWPSAHGRPAVRVTVSEVDQSRRYMEAPTPDWEGARFNKSIGDTLGRSLASQAYDNPGLLDRMASLYSAVRSHRDDISPSISSEPDFLVSASAIIVDYFPDPAQLDTQWQQWQLDGHAERERLEEERRYRRGVNFGEPTTPPPQDPDAATRLAAKDAADRDAILTILYDQRWGAFKATRAPQEA